MKNRGLLYLICLCFNITLLGQESSSQKPKLVVGIVVDQMRFDQLYKYEEKYGEGGFKRIVREGFNYKNANYNYIPTFTAPGHASIFTGAVPGDHGIIGNIWYNRDKGAVQGNVEDGAETIVGSAGENPYGVSPVNLLTTTITDELRLQSNEKAKVISVSLKDRGAILPGGHSANAAYWYDGESSPGYFVSSSYYMEKLPKWVNAFNKLEKADAYLNTSWNTLLPIESYTESDADDNTYEPSLGGKSTPTFPYDFKEMRSKYSEGYSAYQLVLVSPGGNNLLTDFAMEAVKNEKLGVDAITDILTISFSVTDVVGHTFGPQSVELEDVYLRLDKNLEELLKFLDGTIGEDEYLLFLTSDHGVLPVASYLKAHKLPADIARTKAIGNALSAYLKSVYGDYTWISYFQEDQIYLNRTLIEERKLDLSSVQQKAADFMADQEGVHSAITAHDLSTQEYTYGMNRLLQNGYYARRSGDVFLTFDSGIVQNANSEIEVSKVKGTTHGTGYAYDRHVPMLWFGFGIPMGESIRPVAPIDIAPSLAMFLNLQLPSGSTGEPLTELFK